MIWTCPNCGKRVEFSTEQLSETCGVVVCPQCLSSDQVPGYKAMTTSPAHKSRPTPPAHKSRPTPPPHRAKAASTEKASSKSDTQPVKPKKKKKSKKSSGGFLAPKSALGCLWRSVVYTLLLLIIYVIFGMLLQGL